MVYTAKEDFQDVYFIFRENGWEVEFKIIGYVIRCNKKLHLDEVNFIRENLMNK